MNLDDYKDYDVLSREMIGGYSAADFYNATMMNLSSASFLKPLNLRRGRTEAEDALNNAKNTASAVSDRPRSE